MLRMPLSRIAPWIVAMTLAACAANAPPDDSSSNDGAGADTASRQDVTSPPMDAGTDSRMSPDTSVGTDVVTPRDVVVPTDTVTPVADAGGPPGNPVLEDEILAIVNRNRAMGWTCGGVAYPAVGPLVMNPLLQLAARTHSLDMATRNYFAHNTPEGVTPGQRIAATGYVGSPTGENIAAGNATAAATMTQWMNSAGHCVNIMRGTYRSIGVGYAYGAASTYRHYWTQNFGGR